MNKLNKILSEGFANIDEITADACYQLDCVADDSLNKDSISPLLDLMKQSHDRKAEANSMPAFNGLDIGSRSRHFKSINKYGYGSAAISDMANRQYMGAQNMGMAGQGSMWGGSLSGGRLL